MRYLGMRLIRRAVVVVVWRGGENSAGKMLAVKTDMVRKPKRPLVVVVGSYQLWGSRLSIEWSVRFFRTNTPVSWDLSGHVWDKTRPVLEIYARHSGFELYTHHRLPLCWPIMGVTNVALKVTSQVSTGHWFEG